MIGSDSMYASGDTAESLRSAGVLPVGSVEAIPRSELASCAGWESAFAGKRKDHRYYELVEDTMPEGVEYGYFAVKDAYGKVNALQPYFILDVDFLAGMGSRIAAPIVALRRMWPGFLKMRALMVGCTAGEGHLDGDESSHAANASLLASSITAHARNLGAALIVLKEFPAKYRHPLRCFLCQGFSRLPSLPMTRLNIEYLSFDDYMNRALHSATRRKLRKKFRAAEQGQPIEVSVMEDVAPIIDELYPLYLQVYERSKLRFEKLTKDYFHHIGQRMPDKVRFFVWRQEGRAIGFVHCMLEGDTLYAEYIGFDYAVALDLHLYHYAVRDVISWAIKNGYKWFLSTSANYDPKLHLRHVLYPIDLYVRHTSTMANVILPLVLPFVEPVRYEETLKKFSNYHELWGEA